MSHIGNRVALRKNNIKDTDYGWQYSKTPFKSVIDVFNKKADAAGVGDIVLKTMYMKNKIDVNAMKTIYVGPKIAHLPWAVKEDMPKKLVQKIKNTMTSLKDSKSGKAILKSARLNAFLPATNDDYKKVRQIYQEYLDK